MTFPFSPAVVLIASAAFTAAATAPPTTGLDAYLWRKRVVMVFAPTPNDPRLLGQRAQVGSLTRAADDRDLVLVVIAGDQAEPARFDAAALRRRFHVAPGAFRALLVGKDGGVKLDAPGVIGARRLAGAIDAMPMRREETKR